MLKRLLALLLALTMLPLPGAFAGDNGEITPEAYAMVDALWDSLNQEETKLLSRNINQTEVAQQLAERITDHDLYVDGTLRWQGDNHFTFETTVGVTCGYSARLREIARNAEPNPAALRTPDIQTVSYGTKSTASARDVYLFEPYYGIDSDFTQQYQKEGKAIAAATGGTYHLYKTEAATVNAIADGMEKGAVIIFDSHGDTDYARGDDYVSGATTSYILLQTGAGLTTKDYANDNGTYHAVNYGSDGIMNYYAVDGTCIANHMDAPAANGLLWAAICLGMATDGLHAPLIKKGLDVAYGYSQSVSFYYDYRWEEVFYDEMIAGATVAEAIAKMKSKVGNWDWCHEYTSIYQARAYDAAFPIVVSDEDVYPGHGNVDALQTVKSTWTLPIGAAKPEPVVPTVTAVSGNPNLGSVSQTGNTVTAIPADSAYVSGWSLSPENAATVQQNGNVFTLTNLKESCTLTVKFASYQLTGKSEDLTLGTVTVNGRTVTAIPKDSSYVSGWSLSPENAATVKQNGNTFTLTKLKADCTLTVSFAPYQLTAKSGNEQLGTVQINGKTVTAVPTENAYVSGYRIDPAGSATVKQSGNTFTVSGMRDHCCLTVQFAEKVDGGVAARLIFNVPDGISVPPINGFVGDTVTLPTLNGSPEADAYDYTFVGWVKGAAAPTTTAPLYYSGHYTLTESVTELTALYSYSSKLQTYYTTELKNKVCYAKDFHDVSLTMWYHDAVDFVLMEGLMKGVGNGNFQPDGTLTRAMLATILYRIDGDSGEYTDPFLDVPNGKWYSNAISWAYSKGIVNGVSSVLFEPDTPVTREQTAAMLYRYAKTLGSTTVTGNLNQFSDSGKVHSYALIPMAWAVGEGIISGKGNGILDPLGTATRAQIAMMLYNWLT